MTKYEILAEQYVNLVVEHKQLKDELLEKNEAYRNLDELYCEESVYSSRIENVLFHLGATEDDLLALDNGEITELEMIEIVKKNLAICQKD